MMAVDINLDGAILLRDAIVISAINDYKKVLRRSPRNLENNFTLISIERFFHSDLFGKLTFLNGAEILSSLKASFKDGKNLECRRVRNVG